MKLWEYEGKRVRIASAEGRVFIGLADIFSYADDNESGVNSLLFETDDGLFIEIEETEIASIEIIPESMQNMAVAV